MTQECYAWILAELNKEREFYELVDRVATPQSVMKSTVIILNTAKEKFSK